MIIPVKVKEAIRRLGNDSDFTTLITHLNSVREEKLMELEDANVALQTHKLQGYCQALRDIVKSCQS